MPLLMHWQREPARGETAWAVLETAEVFPHSPWRLLELRFVYTLSELRFHEDWYISITLLPAFETAQLKRTVSVHNIMYADIHWRPAWRDVTSGWLRVDFKLWPATPSWVYNLKTLEIAACLRWTGDSCVDISFVKTALIPNVWQWRFKSVEVNIADKIFCDHFGYHKP